MLKILIVSDHKLFREGFTRVFAVRPLFYLMAVCADTHAAITISAAEQPDIVLIDGSTDPLAAIEATKKIQACSTANIIALSRNMDRDFAHHMLAAGALGYLTYQSAAAEIMKAVEEVAKDNLYLCFQNKQLPVPTPERGSSFTKSLASIRDNTRKKITEAASTVHWHAILKFTN